MFACDYDGMILGLLGAAAALGCPAALLAWGLWVQQATPAVAALRLSRPVLPGPGSH